ncbi:hypothetical protein MGI18_23815 [Bacillus sp. OVS6]|nr:hypothetical protein MGI18_23815 [Bacillus sp. OVS6]
MLKVFKLITIVVLGLTVLAQGLPATAKETERNFEENTGGRWMKGEYHAHTSQSDDAQSSQTLELLLDNAFDKYDMDWMAVSDHLRMSSRDADGNVIPGGPIPLSQGIIQYQVPKIKQLLSEGKYRNKIIFSGFEWDMPTYEHVGIGIIGEQAGSAISLKAGSQFEYLFTNRDEKMFEPEDAAAWKAQDERAYSTSQDARTALAWLEKIIKRQVMRF